MIKKIIFFLLAIVVMVLAFVIYTNYPKLEVVSSYSAKKMCSCTFIGGREQESIQAEDLGMFPLSLSSTEIDRVNKRVTTSTLGMYTKVAEYRGKLGCVLIHGEDDYKAAFPPVTIPVSTLENELFPYGDKVVLTKTRNINHSSLMKTADNAFDPNDEMVAKKTRALLIMHKDSLIYEKYANGYSESTPILGWSMTKSIMNTFVGMMIKDSIISLDDASLFPEWEKDERKKITINDLLHMSAGLEWTEEYAEVSPATKMLYGSENNAKVALNLPLEAKPGEHWEYSSGTSNIISGLMRSKFDSHKDYLKFPYERIFSKLNMDNTTIETDESGTYIGSSYCYATARDWARYGTFYLRDGVWNGERLLPEGWVEYTKTHVPDSGGAYGAHFWTNVNGAMYPDAPHTMFSCNGYEGQRIFIIPSKDLVVVRLGLSENFDFNAMLQKICETVDETI